MRATGLVLLIIACVVFVDQPVARWMAGLDSGVRRVFAAITWFGQGGVVLYPTGIIIVLALAIEWLVPAAAGTGRLVAARAGLVFACVAASGIINDILKVAFGRARPDYWLAGDASGFEPFRFGFRFASFPSGHTATSVAAAVAFSALFPRGRLAFAGFAILIATSRVALDAHYVSDVLGGATVGWLTSRWVLQRRHRIGLPSERPQDSGSAIVN